MVGQNRYETDFIRSPTGIWTRMVAFQSAQETSPGGPESGLFKPYYFGMLAVARRMLMLVAVDSR
jgi:hypothetical protein